MAELLRALVGRRWRWVTLAVLALMLVLARLGIWQLDRLAERRAANAQLAAALSAAPIDLNTALTSTPRSRRAMCPPTWPTAM
jgi:cytochrome oxidase assembly protein ShyY1